MTDKTILDTRQWHEKLKTVSLEDAIDRVVSEGGDASGQLESVKGDLEALQNVVARFLRMHIKTVDELNTVAGYERFKETP